MSAGFPGPSAMKGGQRGLTEVGEGKFRHQKCQKQPPLQHMARSTCPRPRLLSCCPGNPPTMHAPWPNAPVPPSQHVWKQTPQLCHRPPSPSGFPFSESGITISVVPWGARNLKVLADTCCSPICCSQSVSKSCSSLEMLLSELPFSLPWTPLWALHGAARGSSMPPQTGGTNLILFSMALKALLL